ncbi:hypothetical protein [Nonomuraea sp. NPDC050310]|uniref:hypothetical protein n=1 Tax=Nonomuraea sp. NPDC050310 TaxID=3154935 RepID=UPI0033E5A3D2
MGSRTATSSVTAAAASWVVANAAGAALRSAEARLAQALQQYFGGAPRLPGSRCGLARPHSGRSQRRWGSAAGMSGQSRLWPGPP